MKLLSIPWNPTPRQLRQFGFCALVGFPLIAWLFLGRSGPAAWDQTDWTIYGFGTGAGALCAALGMFWPAALKPLFVTVSLVTFPIGLVVSETVLAAIYFLVFTPVALFFRLIGRDVLQRRFDSAAPTYWSVKPQATDPLQYYRQS